jgi:hypothetical protein
MLRISDYLAWGVKMDISNIKLRFLLFGAAQFMSLKAQRYPEFRKHLQRKNLTAQIKVLDNSVGRYFIF